CGISTARNSCCTSSDSLPASRDSRPCTSFLSSANRSLTGSCGASRLPTHSPAWTTPSSYRNCSINWSIARSPLPRPVTTVALSAPCSSRAATWKASANGYQQENHMCGIVGWLSYSQDMQAQRNTLKRMTETMANRGPDAEGIWITGPIGFGHRRLSIIDLAGGRQPMLARRDDGLEAAAITYSGEAYNFRELRAELKGRGHRFESLSDTEVVLRAYLEWGEGFVERLNGMYAFAVWDLTTQELLLVRDRMGVKPLYYYETVDGVVFGSEPKALLANPLVPRTVRADGLREILEMVKTPGHAVYDGMREVLPGEVVRIN